MLSQIKEQWADSFPVKTKNKGKRCRSSRMRWLLLFPDWKPFWIFSFRKKKKSSFLKKVEGEKKKKNLLKKYIYIYTGYLLMPKRS